MQLLQDVRSLFRRKHRPVEIDLGRTQAEGLALAVPGGNVQVDDHLEDDAPMPEPDRAPGRVSASTDDVLSLVHRFDDHLDGQAERTERLLALVEHLPPALDALPEINRQNASLLEALHDHLAQSRRREETLGATLTRVGETTDRQMEVLGLIQQQIDLSREATEQLVEPLGGIRSGLHSLARSNSRATEVMAAVEDATARRDAELARALTHTQRWLIGAVILCGTASAAAIITAILALAR